MLCWLDIIFRLGFATLTGSLIGIWLEWKKKPAGMRTFGPVALASAAVVLAAEDLAVDTSRVIQGVIVGVGFLGTAVILKRTQDQEARGVPTAATIWLTASLGVLCGLGAWSIWIIAVVLTAFVLFVGDKIEKLIRPD